MTRALDKARFMRSTQDMPTWDGLENCPGKIVLGIGDKEHRYPKRCSPFLLQASFECCRIEFAKIGHIKSVVAILIQITAIAKAAWSAYLDMHDFVHTCSAVFSIDLCDIAAARLQ